MTELSLTPRFDETAALALDAERNYLNGRAGWEQLTRFSFIERQPDGFYRLHKTMRDALRVRVAGDTAQTVHQWFHEHWTKRREPALAWFHLWTLDPAGALDTWSAKYDTALKELRVAEARMLLTWWTDIALDDTDRRVMGDELWARTHWTLGSALRRLPFGVLAQALTIAIEHYQAALQVYTETRFPREWAETQHQLGNAYAHLPGNRADNLRRAIAYYEAALRVFTEDKFPYDWARTQHNLGNAYAHLPGNRADNLRRAIAYYEAALRVRTEADFPQDWAMTQFNLGLALTKLARETGDSNDLLRARNCFAAAKRGFVSAGLKKRAADADTMETRIEAELAAAEGGSC